MYAIPVGKAMLLCIHYLVMDNFMKLNLPFNKIKKWNVCSDALTCKKCKTMTVILKQYIGIYC